MKKVMRQKMELIKIETLKKLQNVGDFDDVLISKSEANDLLKLFEKATVLTDTVHEMVSSEGNLPLHPSRRKDYWLKRAGILAHSPHSTPICSIDKK